MGHDLQKKVVAPVENHQPTGGEQKTLITMSQVKAIFGREISQALFDDLNQCLEKFHINTPQRKRHFLSQVGHESGGLQWLKEFASGEDYEWVTELGNTKAGDGKRFKGAGAIQLTGRANYQAFSDFMIDERVMEGVDYVAEKYPLTSAGFFWMRNNLNEVCDKPDVTVEKVTRIVNGGINGLNERIEYYQKICDVIK